MALNIGQLTHALNISIQSSWIIRSCRRRSHYHWVFWLLLFCY